jgi:uncharacterized protein YcfL
MVETFILEMKKYLSLIFGLLLLSGCSQLTMLSVAGSTASLVVNNNALVKAYSGVDVITFMVTEKDIKTHVYENTVTKIVKETFILEKPPMLESEKRVLVAVPIIKVKIEDIEWEIESKEWYKIYYSSKFKLFY